MSSTSQKENEYIGKRVTGFNRKPLANLVSLNNRQSLSAKPGNSEVSTPTIRKRMTTDDSTSAKKGKFDNSSKDQEEQKPGPSQESNSSSDEKLASCSNYAKVVTDKVIQRKGKKRLTTCLQKNRIIRGNVEKWRKSGKKYVVVVEVESRSEGRTLLKKVHQWEKKSNRRNRKIVMEDDDEEWEDVESTSDMQNDDIGQNMIDTDTDVQVMVDVEEEVEDDVDQNMSDSDMDDKEEEEKKVEVSENDQKTLVFNKPYVFKLPQEQNEAKLAIKYGSFSLPVKIPGIPWKKFGLQDMEEHGKTDRDWPLQAVYQIDDEDCYFVYYEGWTAQTGETNCKEEIEKNAPEMLRLWETRAEITKAIEKITGDSYFPNLMILKRETTSPFWILEDLAYFHSLYHLEHNLGPLFYMSKRFDIKTYPSYICIHRNFVDLSIEATLKQNPLSANIDDVISENQTKKNFNKIMKRNNWNPCPSKNCKCDIRKRLVYENYAGTSGIKRLRYEKDGRLNFRRSKEEERRFSIECSDACGCDKNCPTRSVQRGQKIPLVVYYEELIKGYGLRAGCDIRKGDLIAEYTGIIRWHKDVKDHMYSVDCRNFKEGVLIDSMEKGNVARFANHSCRANSIFVETHSRVFESATLIPRVGLFARKDIAMGEKVTVNYYGKEILKDAAMNKKSNIPCLCGAKGCLKWLPTKW